MHGQDMMWPGLGGQGSQVSLRRRDLSKYMRWKAVRDSVKRLFEGRALQAMETASAKALGSMYVQGVAGVVKE